ncbi:MAG: BamA/TamA family outer membrane protein [Planctomycetota bacterium]|nr:BamA/TamA family outer membrane protein [Planctomycetota bacterium]
MTHSDARPDKDASDAGSGSGVSSAPVIVRTPGPTRFHPSVPRALLRAAGVALGLALPAGSAALAQAPSAPPPTQPGDLDALEGRVIREVLVRRPDTSEGAAPGALAAVDAQTESLAINQVRVREGAAYTAAAISQDINRLNRLGRFKRVESLAQLMDDGSVRVIYLVVPQPIVRDVQAVGNRQISNQDIAKEVDVLVGTPIDNLQLDRASRRVQDLYRKRGYYFAQVTVDREHLEKTDGEVLFRIREGERVKVAEIRFEGNTAFSPSELKDKLKPREAWLLDRGPVDDNALDTDVAELVRFYRDRGYLDVRADRQVRPSPNGREAIVTFLIDEGRVYTLRSVDVVYPEREMRSFRTVEAAQAAMGPDDRMMVLGPGEVTLFKGGVLSPAQVQGLMFLKPGDVYAVNKINESTESIRAAIGKLGYADVEVERKERRAEDRPEVDLLFIIREGQRFRTGEVIIRGSELTQQAVVRRQVQLQPERPLDATAIQETKVRLEDLRLFDLDPRRAPRVTLQKPDELDPRYRDVLVEVQDTNTGRFSIGGAVASDSGVTGRIALEQNNFDVADTPSTFGELTSGRAFRGAGQTFQIEALPGSEIQTYSVSLSEPYLLETNFSGSVSAFYNERSFDEYTEERLGGNFAVGRRFGTRWTGSIPVRGESILLRDFQADRPVEITRYEGRNLLTGVGVTLSRNTLDDRFVPGKGSKLDLSAEQVGSLGGDFNFTKFSAGYQVFLTIHEDFFGYRTVLKLSTSASYIPQSESKVPVYERYYLGGQSLRGFEFRTVSPRGTRPDGTVTTNTPVGGTFAFFAGTELRQPLWEDILSVVWFVDSGTVRNSPGLSEYRVSTGLGLRIYIKQLSPAPLAFDFGTPLKKEKFDEKRLFTFSVDLPF